jgi:hypothetical protein
MTNKFKLFAIGIFITLCFGSCKFYFNESEYLGTYAGSFETETILYKSCNGHVNIIDVGDNLVNLELVTDSNPTFYYSGVKVERGNWLNSSDLRITDNNLNVYISRTTHDITFYNYGSSGYYEYSFGGTRQ